MGAAPFSRSLNLILSVTDVFNKFVKGMRLSFFFEYMFILVTFKLSHLFFFSHFDFVLLFFSYQHFCKVSLAHINFVLLFLSYQLLLFCYIIGASGFISLLLLLPFQSFGFAFFIVFTLEIRV
jgi:hypothetical protein